MEYSNDIEMSDAVENDSFKEEDNASDDFEYLPSDTKTPGEVLDEFCSKLSDINTTIPDPVIMHYMKKAGFIASDPKLVKLISLASQKFISEIVNDCMQLHKLKTNTRPTGAAATSSTTSTSTSIFSRQTGQVIMRLNSL